MLDAAPDFAADGFNGTVGVNQAEAVWLRVGDGLIPLRHALEEGAVVFLEAVALDVEREMRLARKPT